MTPAQTEATRKMTDAMNSWAEAYRRLMLQKCREINEIWKERRIVSALTETTTERIAKARTTFLGIEDHGIFTGVIDLDYGGAGQGAGTLCLDYNDRESGRRVESTPGAVHRWVLGCIRAFGVDQWEKIPGRTVIAIIEGGMVRGLKPLPTERGEVFMFSEVGDDRK